MSGDHGCAGAACSSTEGVAGAVGPVLARPAAPVVGGPGDDRVWLRIDGLDCAEEVATLKRALRDLVVEDALAFDVLNGRLGVPAAADQPAVVAAVAATGMRAHPWHPDTADADDASGLGLRDWLVVGSVLSTVGGFAVHAWMAGATAAIGSEGAGVAASVPWGARLVYLVAILSGLWVVLPKAMYAVRSLRPDMNLLMTVAVAGAVTIGEWFEAATVSSLFALSLALEAWSVGRARRAVSALMRLAPDTVRVRSCCGDERDVDPSSVSPGAVFVVRPGERIGLDGTVSEGLSDVDQAPITGESVPVDKAPGDDVFAGTINGSGALVVTSTRAAGDTTLARIVRQVADSQANRAQSERFVERFARVYTPAILGLALLVAVIPPLLGAGWADWGYRALVLLVIGCPCALVISTPVAIVASLASSARSGVLLKGGRVAELPATLAVVALDKTGTLTEGRPRVVDVAPWGGRDAAAVVAGAAALEHLSTHPIALAILQYADTLGLSVRPAVDVSSLHGRGMRGRVDGRPVWLGSDRWLRERGRETPELRARVAELTAAGRSVVVVGDEESVWGLIAVADQVRPESAASVAALKAAGVRRVVMLTGDNQATADAVGLAVGVDEVLAELLPEDKVAAIERLERTYGPTAMVGDGVNDAPALARATLGVAMGAAGTDVAIETADIALMGDDLSKLGWLIGHSRDTVGVIRANVVLALGIKLVFVVLTFAGVASLWGAVAADMGASLLVVANALRLLRRSS